MCMMVIPIKTILMFEEDLVNQPTMLIYKNMLKENKPSFFDLMTLLVH